MRFIVTVIYLEYLFNRSNNGSSKKENKFNELIVCTIHLKDYFV